MHNLRRWYYENKDKVWITILAAGFILICINVFNNIYINKPVNQTNTNTVSTKETINNEITGKLDDTTSLITGNGKNADVLKKDTKIIDEFIRNCNNGKIQEAYDMLTEECKEEVFPTIESFKNKYYNNVFSTPKTYSMQNWVKDTYKLMITDDALSTGKVSENETHLQEYITVKSTEEGEKLNINNYIGRSVKNKVSTKDEVEVTFVKKETYMNYEDYTIQVKNLTNSEIILDNEENMNTIYLQDENGLKQYVSTTGINYDSLKLLPGVTQEYTFRFQNTYSITRVMEFLVFEKTIINNNGYKKIMINVL